MLEAFFKRGGRDFFFSDIVYGLSRKHNCFLLFPSVFFTLTEQNTAQAD